MSEEIYDIAVIGAGPGGYHAAIRAAQFGAKVALIEKEKLGGTCLNWGCIPTKALYASSELIQKIKTHGEEFGVKCSMELDFAKAVERKNKVVNELVEGIGGLQKVWKNDVYMGHGKIVGGNKDDGFEIAIEGEENTTIKSKRIIIATGSSPALIPAFNIDHERILTSDDILDPNFKEVPKRLLVIGAGVIGCEFANIFATFGSKVTMLEYLPSPIATEEPMVVRELQKKFDELEIELHVSQNVLSVENTGNGIKATTCSADVPRDEVDNAEKNTFEADYCLVSIGRAKESGDLGLEELGIETERGAIKVNSDKLETSVEGIYAIGDVTGGVMLAHVASYEGDIAVENALTSIGGFPTKERTTNYSVVPATIFTSPNIGSVGLRRKDAKEKGIKVSMGRFTFESLGKAKCMGETEGFILVLANKETGEIVGASCIGAEAPELIAEIALAMQHGLNVHDIGATIHSHPTISEMVLEGVEDTYGMAIHKRGRPDPHFGKSH
ncbi:MAG: dihydrolipoyl dehydrogenase [Candidatus Lokiarchaeota archaeon]|nr:dihydrolipoyl dehydrogenase [Candidatus Lokiarchaeota archaeon]MBD3201807.1 dihydrolipoyl dehydrogenase [Candidatus Lokiarchaeota archaeon]